MTLLADPPRSPSLRRLATRLGLLSLVAPMLAPVLGCGTPVASAAGAPDDTTLYELDTAAQPKPAASSNLDKVLKGSELRVCVRSDVPPFGSFTATGLDGFDVALATEVANQISIDYKQALTVEWVVVGAGERIKRLQDGACDILVAALSYTKERATQVATSKVYLRTDKVLLAATKVTRKVPVIARIGGTTGGELVELKGTARVFNTYQEVVHAMDFEEIDYLVTDRPIAEHLIRSTTKGYKIAKTLAENAESYVVATGTASPELTAAVNRALSDLARTGRLALLHRRWL
jgi:polar amino acid transport system substrate-binding protein